MRRSVVIVAVMLALAFVAIGGPSLLLTPTTEEIAPEADTEPEIVRPTGGESGFWPYLNDRRAFEKRSPINVVVEAETDEVLRLLTESRDADWEETDEELDEVEAGESAEALQNASVGDENDSEEENGSGDVPVREDEPPGNGSDGNGSIAEQRIEVGATEIRWGRTTGASRYAYVDPGYGEDGMWVEETAQVHDGTYYGHRYHVRLYESPNPEEPWVAMQTHSEHFDWFTLRHRVHGTNRAQMRLEADLMALPQVDDQRDVSRVNIGNRGASDADGWATFVTLFGAVMLGFAMGGSARGSLDRIGAVVGARLTEEDRRRIDAARERVDPRHPVLAGTIVAVVLGVRASGIALEDTGLLSMHAIAAALYPLIGLGLPVGTYLIASGLERRIDAAAVAGTSLAVAFWFDYGRLGVSTLPVDVIFQRMLAVVALGLIAGGAARRATRETRWNDMLIAGVALWVTVMGGTLFGYL